MKPSPARISSRLLRRFFGDRSGAALVEFAIALPLFLILFAVTVDGARMLWSYQKSVAGVRDATRYLARVSDLDLCSGGGSLAGRQSELETIVRTSLTTGANIIPSGVQLLSVVPAHSCVTGGFRNGPVAIASVTARLEITMPFSTVFQLVGGSVGTFQATVTDSTRVFGS